MKRVDSIELYKEISRIARKKGAKLVTNNYLSLTDVKRYIRLGNLYYHFSGDNLLVFSDEKKYYRLFYTGNMLGTFEVPKTEKPVMVRNIFRNNQKTEQLLGIESMLREQGFNLVDTSVQIKANPLENKEKWIIKARQMDERLKRFGISIRYATKNDYIGIMTLRDATPELKYFQFQYQTRDEVENDIEKCLYRVAVNDGNEVCAAQYFLVGNGVANGEWLAVKSEYRLAYGLGAAMAYDSFLYAIDQGIENYFGWVMSCNQKSLDYHASLGYSMTDKLADDWLRE